MMSSSSSVDTDPGGLALAGYDFIMLALLLLALMVVCFVEWVNKDR